MPSLSHCQVSQRAPCRSHLWAMEPKPVAYVGLARLHHQLGSKAQPHPSSETLSTSPGTILNLARKGISDCTRQKKGSIKTYSLLKMHLSQPGEGRPHLLFTENLDFFPVLCLYTSPPPLPIRQVIRETNLIYYKIFLRQVKLKKKLLVCQLP